MAPSGTNVGPFPPAQLRERRELPVQSLITDVVHLSLGWSCCAILTDESLRCWSTWSDTDTSVVPVRSPWVDRAARLPSQEPHCVLLPDATATGAVLASLLGTR